MAMNWKSSKRWNNLSFEFFLFLVLCFSSVSATPEQEFPVLYKGRYRPAEAYARLWLYDMSHASTLKQKDLASFHATSSSPLVLLEALDILGNAPYQTAPLFWIPSAEFKQLAHLPLTRDRFSYQELQQAFYHEQSSSRSLFQRLATYHFLQSSVEASSSARVELSSLLPGLWMQRRGDNLVVVAAPLHSPWAFLKKGEIFPLGNRQVKEILAHDRKLAEEWTHLLTSLKEFERLSEISSPMEHAFKARVAELQATSMPPKEIQRLLEQEYPLVQRLRTAGPLFQSLPSRYKEGEWFSLQALTIETFDPSSSVLKPVGNFTSFSDVDFETIRQAYLDFAKALKDPHQKTNLLENRRSLAHALQQGYQPLAGKVFQEAHGKQLTYPTLTQLKVETVYVNRPWIPLLIFLYVIGACLLFLSYRLLLPWGHLVALSIISLAILCHTALLAMRCYILERPPVSNMFETVLYVPWVAMCVSLLFPVFRRQTLVLLAACLTSITLLLILEVTDLNQSLDQVQAVLDSQFWLMIHVLLVVGSYGIFILGAVIGHVYLGLYIAQRQETATLHLLSQIILQTLYGGTTLLVTGTILGGIWAAESWGRFWDWDPKESWAFISSCFYLLWIHAYRFNRIASFGLAIGAVSGLLAISFTWYGVNYILGTGLHSYGFGSGGAHYYYAFLGLESLFLATALWAYRSSHSLKSDSSPSI